MKFNLKYLSSSHLDCQQDQKVWSWEFLLNTYNTHELDPDIHTEAEFKEFEPRLKFETWIKYQINS